MYRFLRPLLFRLDPETAHELTLNLLRMAGRLPPARWLLQALFATLDKPVEVFGRRFKNPVGLAAGYDKDGIAIGGLMALGFGHLEIGTVTPKPQAGNPKPRIFRLAEDEAVINRMGFPSQGGEIVECHLWDHNHAPRKVLLGINLGKNKDTPVEEAVHDYILLMWLFMRHADYLVLNISSPNTVGLRRLQGRDLLESMLAEAWKTRREIALQQPEYAPILVKLAPDLNDDELDDALGVIIDQRMDGVIVTNTTLGREGLRSTLKEESGGLSGRPLTARSEAMLGKVVKCLDGRLPVISAGGIMSPEDAKRRLEMGAALVQVYTGLVYAGPGLVREIVRGL